MPLEFTGAIETSGSIAIESQQELVPPTAAFYYSFDNSLLRDIYIETTSRSNYQNFSVPFLLSTNDTITFNVPLSRTDWNYIWLSGSGFEFGFDTSYNLVEINCELTSINSRTDPQEIQDFLDTEMSNVNSAPVYLTVELRITAPCSIYRLGGPPNGGSNAIGSINITGLEGIPIINVVIDTVSTGSYFWPLDSIAQGVSQLEASLNGPSIDFTNYNVSRWNGSASGGQTAIHFNDDAQFDPGDRVISDIGSSSQFNNITASVINNTGSSITAQIGDSYNFTLPIDLSAGYTLAYDVIFNSLGSRNGNIRTGGISASANSDTTTRFSLLGDNYDSSGITSIAFTLLGQGIYLNRFSYPTLVLSEVRDPAPIQLGVPYRIIAIARPAPLNQIELYVNGTLIGTNIYPTSVQDGTEYNSLNSTLNLRIGDQYTDGLFPASSTTIDEFRFYNRPLTAQELLAFNI
jgi:hypothetical protein